RRQQPFAYSSVSGREEFYFLTTNAALAPITPPETTDPIGPGQQSPVAPTVRPKDRIEPGQQAPAALSAAQKVVLYEEDSADLRRFGDLADRDHHARSRTTARACHSRRRRSARAKARDDLVAPSQHGQEAARDPHGRNQVQGAGRFPRWRHLQRSRHPDEASR